MTSIKMSEIRTEKFKRNNTLEAFLPEINSDLWITEKCLIDKYTLEYPLVFIVGPLRSGSTLMLQWLAGTNEFCYPTNMLSRFYNAPIIGSKIQRLLTDEAFNFRNEIMDFDTKIEFKSENGKTKGALAPNEFWYFWRRFLPFEDIDYLPDHELVKQVNVEILKAELNGIANVFGKPFALKAMICNYNIDFLDKLFDKAIFIYTKRNPYTNIESALKARERQLGSTEEWYSFKIPEYNELIKIKDPILQTAGQIYYINQAVEKGLEGVADDKKVVVDYEEFCKNPKIFYNEIAEKLKKMDFNIEMNYTGPESFSVTRDEVVDERIIEAYNSYKSND